MQFCLSQIFGGWLTFLWFGDFLVHSPGPPEAQFEIHPFQRRPLWAVLDSSITSDLIKLFLEYWNQHTSKKAAMGKRKKAPSPTKAHRLMSQSVLCIAFTHLLFLSFPGFLLLQFYLLWKKFLRYLMRNKGVQIPKVKDTEEDHQCFTRINL